MTTAEIVKKACVELGITGCSVTVALSGGADSMSLLNILLSLKDELSIEVSAAHVNHMLRGVAADSDEAFVKKSCKELDIPLYCKRIDVAKASRRSGMGIEETARRLRYEYLLSVCGDYLATAHNKNDNAETVLLNITRGCGVHGICGIPQKRGKIIRPLLGVSRAEIETYTAKNNIEYVTDATNFCEDYSRNRIRGSVIPELQKINPSFLSAVSRLSKIAAVEDKFLDSEAEKLLHRAKIDGGYDAQIISSADSAVRYRALALLSKEFSKQNIAFSHLSEIDNLLQSGGKNNLPANFFAEVKNGRLSLYRKNDLNTDESFCFPFEIGEKKFDGFTVKSGFVSGEEFKQAKDVNILANIIMLDYDIIPHNIYLRSRVSGDRFRSFGSSCTKSLKKLFNESGIVQNMRQKTVVIASDDDIVAVEGFGASFKYGVTDNTKNILSIKIIRD